VTERRGPIGTKASSSVVRFQLQHTKDLAKMYPTRPEISCTHGRPRGLVDPASWWTLVDTSARTTRGLALSARRALAVPRLHHCRPDAIAVTARRFSRGLGPRQRRARCPISTLSRRFEKTTALGFLDRVYAQDEDSRNGGGIGRSSRVFASCSPWNPCQADSSQ